MLEIGLRCNEIRFDNFKRVQNAVAAGTLHPYVRCPVCHDRLSKCFRVKNWFVNQVKSVDFYWLI